MYLHRAKQTKKQKYTVTVLFFVSYKALDVQIFLVGFNIWHKVSQFFVDSVSFLF